MFGQQKSVSWISKTLLSKASEEQIKKCFQETPIEFHYSKDLNDFKLLIETFQKKILVTTITMKVMNKVYFFGDKKNLINLLSWTTSQVLQITLVALAVFWRFLKSLITAAVIFFIFYTRINQTGRPNTDQNIQHFSFHYSTKKYIKNSSDNCNKESFSYIQSRDNRLYVEISKQNPGCLIIDCNNSGPAKYRTKADNIFEQFLHFKQKKKTNCSVSFLLKNFFRTIQTVFFK